jgi:glycosyltransferase A (GT-A) superfamily protein (DUF2064 family)
VPDRISCQVPCRGHLAAVVPVWNEVEAIGGVVRGLQDAGACCVYVVDPGSGDGTQQAAAAAGAQVVEEPRRGYGRACLAGAAHARDHQLIAFLDGDGSCDPAELPALAAPASTGRAELVLGRRSRVARGALPWHARLGNRVVAALLHLRTGRPVHDLSPFKVVRASALDGLGLDDEGYGWTAQLIGRALAHPGLRVVEVPVSFRPRLGGLSKVSGRLGPSLRAGRAMLGQSWSATRGRGALVMMAKAPRAGHSKTRLEREIGSAAAAGFWRACLRDSARTMRLAALETGTQALAITPSAEDAEMVRSISGLPCLVQRGSGLGAALLHASELGAPFAVSVSADAPTLPPERLREAVAAVRAGRPVLGPGPDGGYYLVGLPRGVTVSRRRRAFLEAPIGSQDAFAHARRALGAVQVLEPWPDVDTAAELAALAVELSRDPSRAPAVRAWLEEERREAG